MGKVKGFVRNIDSLGRIVLPIELRRTLSMDIHEGVEIIPNGDSLIVRKYAPGCVLCNSLNELHTIEGKQICMECRIKFGKTTGR